MRIAVISDTHDRYPDLLIPHLLIADAIWHLGDVCEPMVLAELEALGRPLKVVRGNCDWEERWPLTLDFEQEGFQIRLVHIPPKKNPPGFDLLLHGHTHVPKDEMIGSTRFLNPGCVTRPNRGASASWAWLELQRGHLPRWELMPLS